MGARPRFDFVRLLADLLVEHRMPPPVYLPLTYPVQGRVAYTCLYSGIDSAGSGPDDSEARNAAARQVWLDVGQLITMDPRCLSKYVLSHSHLYSLSGISYCFW